MTPEEARERIGEIRIELRRAMRSVSVPDVDWDEADAAVARVQALVTDMTEAMAACERRNEERGRYGDR